MKSSQPFLKFLPTLKCYGTLFTLYFCILLYWLKLTISLWRIRSLFVGANFSLSASLFIQLVVSFIFISFIAYTIQSGILNLFCFISLPFLLLIFAISDFFYAMLLYFNEDLVSDLRYLKSITKLDSLFR